MCSDSNLNCMSDARDCYSALAMANSDIYWQVLFDVKMG
jgi:hypothetical protein